VKGAGGIGDGAVGETFGAAVERDGDAGDSLVGGSIDHGAFDRNALLGEDQWGKQE
jgi:hypothetical protein